MGTQKRITNKTKPALWSIMLAVLFSCFCVTSFSQDNAFSFSVPATEVLAIFSLPQKSISYRAAQRLFRKNKSSFPTRPLNFTAALQQYNQQVKIKLAYLTRKFIPTSTAHILLPLTTYSENPEAASNWL